MDELEKFLKELEKEASTDTPNMNKLTELVDKISQAISELKPLAQSQMDIVNSMVNNIISNIKGEKGDKGDDAADPSDERLISLILPLIPKPIKGDKGDRGERGASPTKEEILDLLYPLIPEPVKGDRGEDGIDGKDGSPDTGEQIIEKINSDESDAKIDASKIKNLPEATRQVVRQVGSGNIEVYSNGDKKGAGQGISFSERFIVTHDGHSGHIDLDSTVDLITDSTTNRDLVLTDIDKYIRMTNASTKTITVPPESDVAWTEGAVITIRNAGAGALTFVEGSGVTLLPDDLELDEYGTAQLVKVATDTWDII